jgi:hypothetical protein
VDESVWVRFTSVTPQAIGLFVRSLAQATAVELFSGMNGFNVSVQMEFGNEFRCALGALVILTASMPLQVDV